MFALNPLEPREPARIDAEDVTIKEDEGVQRLGLGARRNPTISRQMIKVSLKLGAAELARVAFAMEQDVLAGPESVTRCRPRAVVAPLAGKPHLIEQSGLGGRKGRKGGYTP